MKDPIQYLPVPERHWSFNPGARQTRLHRADCLAAARKGLTLEELALRKQKARNLRIGRRIGVAMGLALCRAAGVEPEIRPVKGVRRSVEVTVNIKLTESDLF